jgi:DNA-binding IclR family transcriptional regulator
MGLPVAPFATDLFGPDAIIMRGINGANWRLKDYEARGFVLSLGDWERDINAVGVPLIAPDGSGVFAFNCGAPGFHFTRERLESDIGPRLVNMMRNVEVALSGR